MRFTINREEFLKGLTTSGRAINPKNAIAALTNLKIDLNENGLFITGSNRDLTIRTLVPYFSDDKEIIRNYQHGSLLVNLKIIDFCREVKTDEVIVEVNDSTIATITSGNGNNEMTLQCMKVEEYYDVDLEPDNIEVTLPKQEFSNIVNQTAFAASIKESRMVLTALNLRANEGLLITTATDSARMARKETIIPDSTSFTANIPARMMVEVDRLLEGQEYITISIGSNKALFSFDRIVVATTLIAGEYPNTDRAVPKAINYSLTVKTNEFLSAIRLANLVTERENIVDLLASPETVQISAKSAQTGSGVNKIENFRYEGEQLKISFNSESITQAIKALNCEDVTFEFIGEGKPFIIRNPADDSIIQVSTPVNPYY